MKKLTFLFIALMVFGFLISNIHLGLAQTATPVNGIINSDTTWTKVNSPYSLTGPVTISAGVILTIEAGVTVDLNNYFILVNGALEAVGNEVSPIDIFGLGNITFTSLSTSWNQQTGAGSIIENTSLPAVYIQSASPKINGCSIFSLTIDGGSPIISNNIIFYNLYNIPSYNLGDHGLLIKDGTPIISNNQLNYLEIRGGSPIILGNKITLFTTISINVSQGSPIISNNTIMGQILRDSYGRPRDIDTYAINLNGNGNTTIIDNYFSGQFSYGISITSSNPTILRNVIKIQGTGIKNIGGFPQIENNSISGCYIGVVASNSQIIIYNNIENNSYKNLYVSSTNNINVSYNWWGTIDTALINQTIYDSKDVPKMGTANFTPFLASPNPQAKPNLSANLPAPSTSTTIPEFPSIVYIAILMIMIAIISVKKGKRKTDS